jgi:hypothetical protein
MRSILFLVVMAIGPISGCIADSEFSRSARQPLVDTLHMQRMMVLSRPPYIAIMQPEDLPVALRVAENTDSARLSKRETARWVNVDSLPFLTSTEYGNKFLDATKPRALAQGIPPGICPVVAVASGAPETPRADIVTEALQSCMAKISVAQPGCGCRIVALDDLVAVPREDTVYATGTTARIRSVALGIDLFLVAEETVDGNTLLRDLNGPVAHLVRGENDAVTVSFLSTGHRFDGYRIPVGFRRGRIAERIYSTDVDGNRLSLLIGFEPGELANGAGAWLAWPPEG